MKKKNYLVLAIAALIAILSIAGCAEKKRMQINGRGLLLKNG